MKTRFFLLAIVLFLPLTAFGITCDKYVRGSDGSDGDDGSTWALAYDTLDYAFDQVSAGDTVCVDDDHTESSAADIILTSAGTITNPVKVVVVVTDTTTPVTNYSATANLDTTGSGDSIDISGGSVYIYGLHIKPFDGLLFKGAGAMHILENSKVDDVNSDLGSALTIYQATDTQMVKLIDFTLKNGSLITKAGGLIEWFGGGYESTGIEHSYLTHNSGEGGDITIHGVDLSAWAGATALIETTTASSDHDLIVRIEDSKLPAAVTYFNGSPHNNRNTFIIEGSDDQDEFWQYFEQQYAGTIENTVLVDRTGGATYDGTNGFSVKLMTNGNAAKAIACVRKHLISYGGVDSTSGANAAVHVTYDSATQWENDEFFIELKYPDATDEALGNWVRTRPTPLLAGTPDSADFTDVSGTETWTGTSGFTNPREETVDVDFTGAEGLIEIWVNFCKPSETIYVGPFPDITANEPVYEFANAA